MKLSAKGGQAKPVAANATGFNPWKFTFAQYSNKGQNIARTIPRFFSISEKYHNSPDTGLRKFLVPCWNC